MLTLALALAVQAPDSLSIRFIGNEAFAVTDGQTTLVTDFPYRSGAFGYMAYQPPDRFAGQVLALITHRHLDHFDPAEWRDSTWSILGPGEVTAAVRGGRVLPMDSVVRLGPLTIRALRSPHSGTEHYSYLVDWGGLRFYFAGDTEDPASLLASKGITHAFLTPWLWSAIGRDPGRIGAEMIIFYHHTLGQRVPTCSRCWLPTQNETRRVAVRPSAVGR